MAVVYVTTATFDFYLDLFTVHVTDYRLQVVCKKLKTPGDFLSGTLIDIIPAKQNYFNLKPVIILEENEEKIFFELHRELQKIPWKTHLNQYVYIVRSANLENEYCNFVSPTFKVYTEHIEGRISW